MNYSTKRNNVIKILLLVGIVLVSVFLSGCIIQDLREEDEFGCKDKTGTYYSWLCCLDCEESNYTFKRFQQELDAQDICLCVDEKGKTVNIWG